MKSLNEKKPKIMILGEELDPEEFPVLYRQAQNNREAVESQVSSILAKIWANNPEAVGMCLINLEMDLQREKDLLSN